MGDSEDARQAEFERLMAIGETKRAAAARTQERAARVRDRGGVLTALGVILGFLTLRSWSVEQDKVDDAEIHYRLTGEALIDPTDYKLVVLFGLLAAAALAAGVVLLAIGTGQAYGRSRILGE